MAEICHRPNNLVANVVKIKHSKTIHYYLDNFFRCKQSEKIFNNWLIQKPTIFVIFQIKTYICKDCKF